MKILLLLFCLQFIQIYAQQIESENSVEKTNSCGINCEWEIQETTLIIKGNGEMENYTKIDGENPTMWHQYKYAIKKGCLFNILEK